MSAVRPSFLALCLFVAVLAHVIPAVLGQVTCMQQLNQLGGYYSPLDGKCDPYIPGVNAASTAAADHTTGATFTSTAVNSLNSITNFVIVLLANDGFDNLLGTFAGANNLAKSTIGPQVQRNGTSYGATLAGLGVDPYNYNFDSNGLCSSPPPPLSHPRPLLPAHLSSLLPLSLCQCPTPRLTC